MHVRCKICVQINFLLGKFSVVIFALHWYVTHHLFILPEVSYVKPRIKTDITTQF